MNEHNLVPNIRFNGFDDEWTNKKFINFLAKIIDFRGKTPKKLGLSWSNNGKYRALSAINVKNGFIDKNIDVHFGNYDLYKKWMGNTELEKGDILFTTEAPMGNIAIINDNDKYILSQRTIAFRVNAKNINGSFLLYRLNTVSTKNKLMRLSTGGTAQGISQKNLSYLIISVSNSIKEQQKIGDFFSKLDKLLDLQQQKIDKLELLKKALLQKLFPKDNSKIPELRFKGFKDEWQEKKLSYVVEIIMGQSPSSINYYDTPIENSMILIQGNADIKHHNVKPRVWTTQITKITIPKDVLLTVRAPVGEVAKNKYEAVIGRGMAALRGNDFLYYNLEKLKMIGHWERLSTGSTFESISSNDIRDTKIKMPSYKEQKRVYSLFSKVDQLIELENKKLHNLQQVKKCLLQNMFVE